jgi:hypothetical protein
VLDYLADPADPSQRLYTRRRRRAGEVWKGSLRPSRAFVTQDGHPIWNAVACGTSRTWTESTTMPRLVAPT